MILKFIFEKNQYPSKEIDPVFLFATKVLSPNPYSEIVIVFPPHQWNPSAVVLRFLCHKAPVHAVYIQLVCVQYIQNQYHSRHPSDPMFLVAISLLTVYPSSEVESHLSTSVQHEYDWLCFFLYAFPSNALVPVYVLCAFIFAKRPSRFPYPSDLFCRIFSDAGANADDSLRSRFLLVSVVVAAAATIRAIGETFLRTVLWCNCNAASGVPL